MDLLEILPQDVRASYQDAVRAESFRRATAFLSLPEDVGGYMIEQPTLRHYLILRAIKSPLLTGAIPTDLELAAFLWLLNPDYHPTRGRKRFLKTCRRFRIPRMPFIRTPWAMRRWRARAAQALLLARDVIRKCRSVIADAFADCIFSGSVRGLHKSYYCDAAMIIGELAREYGWSPSDIMNMKMSQIAQFRREIAEKYNPNSQFANSASDKILNDWMIELNRKQATGDN